jgi:LuxR family maltose regulon positive regulatory protein
MTSTGWPVAWLSLDESDNNLAQFWDYLIAALEQVQPDLSSLLAGISRQSFRDADTSFAIALINAISSFPKQFSLVLDNYHTIDSPVVHNDINYLLGYLPTFRKDGFLLSSWPRHPCSDWAALLKSINILKISAGITSTS